MQEAELALAYEAAAAADTDTDADAATPPTEPAPACLPRQRHFLRCVSALGDRVPARVLHQWLFLSRNAGGERHYDYVPAPGGPVSFTALRDAATLVRRGLLVDDDARYLLTAHGRTIAGDDAALALAAVSWVPRSLSVTALDTEIRRLFPSRARSPGAMPYRDRASVPVLHTIGYEGRSLEAYLDVLLTASVSALFDVGKNAVSRNVGFSRAALEDACDVVGIRYVHLPALGGDAAESRAVETREDEDALFDAYERDSDARGDALEEIRSAVRDGERIALGCFESDPAECHRHRLARFLANELRVGIDDL